VFCIVSAVAIQGYDGISVHTVKPWGELICC